MKRIATYIAVFVAMILAAACTMNEFFEPTFPSGSDDNVIIIRPRISHFADCNVSTRSAKEGDEAKVTSMAMALFPIEGDQIQPCVYYQYNDDGNMLFVLDRNRPPFTDAEGNEPYPYKNKEFVMYVIANMQGADIPVKSGYVNGAGKVAVYQPDGSVEINGDIDNLNEQCGAGWTVDDFVKKSHSVEDGSCFEKIHENGLPMIGSLGDCISEFGDNNTFVFHPDKVADVNENGLPTVNGTPTDNLEIPMRSLYAKFTFTISVDSEQEIIGNPAPRFDLSSYQVVNAAKTVFLERSSNEDNDETGYDDVASSEKHNVATEGLYAQGATKATFFLYVPERTFDPDVIPLESYVYDFGENGGECVGYDAIPPEMKKYAQRFKPELAEGLNATHVEINGTFTDHQKHIYNVTYKIYLGADNYGNFDIIRNTHYNNFITIKGIDNSDDESANYDPDNLPDGAIAPISIDHRVSIERTTPLVVGLRRETLLDAHIEVRPLRLHLSGGDQKTNPTSATVTLLKARDSDLALSTWIAMEKSGSTEDHITGTGTPSDGKRKFFTTNLIKDIYTAANVPDDGNIVITVDGLGYDANQTIWLYADENTTTNARSAVLQIEYNYKDPDTQEVAAPENYIITQHGLFKVKGADSGRDYYIENFEEYLYNYDVEDIYGQTKQEGMPWGLDGVQLSNEHNSFYIDEENEDWNNYVANNQLLKYDFYIAKYDSFVTEGVTVHGFAGQHFTSEIFDATESNTDVNKKVNVLTMADQPKGAVEYCYNRNKRNSDGSIAKVEWYLPSADELEDIIVPAYSTFAEFQDNYYWTSQPAYIRDAFYYEYATGRSQGNNVRDAYAFVAYEENKQYARATKVVAKGNNVYDYALSGLNKIPTDAHLHESFPNEQLLGDSYFTNMYAWYRWNGNTKAEPKQADEHFNEKRNSSETGVRYYVPIGHSYDKMYQKDGKGEHGYHPRTKSNRVRCARREWNPDKNYEMEIVYIVSTTPATTLDKSGNTKYVIRNANYPSTSLTTSDNNVAASSSALGINNYFVIEGNKIKSVAKNENPYFSGYDGNVSFNNSGTSYTINNSGSGFTISHTESFLFWSTTYFLKQTSDTEVKIEENNNGNTTWQFYEVKKEYKVVE